MSAYNFQPRFVPLIESGVKRSTIRKRPKKGRLPEPGEAVNLYVYQRTRQCRKIRTVTVTRVRPIVVNTVNDHGDYSIDEVVFDGLVMLSADIEAMARADGFDNASDFAKFFHEQYGPEVSAYLIEWFPPGSETPKGGV